LRWEDITRGNDTRECVVLGKGASDFMKDRGVKAGYLVKNKFPKLGRGRLSAHVGPAPKKAQGCGGAIVGSSSGSGSDGDNDDDSNYNNSQVSDDSESPRDGKLHRPSRSHHDPTSKRSCKARFQLSPSSTIPALSVATTMTVRSAMTVKADGMPGDVIESGHRLHVTSSSPAREAIIFET
jgi:hypothetical protein